MKGEGMNVLSRPDEILRYPNVVNAGTSDYMPYLSTNWTRVSWEGAAEGELMKVNVNYVDENLILTYGMTIVEGTGFSKSMRSSEENEVILNETAAKRIGWEEPISFIGNQYHGAFDKRVCLIHAEG